jgi:hypothetical protein
MISITPSADHPIPFDLSEELPTTVAQSVAIAANTVDLLEQLGASIDFKPEDFAKAASLAKGEKQTPQVSNITNPGTAKVLSIAIKEYDFQVFTDVQQARNFVTSKLVKLADCGDPKLELKALELLGKHSDIGLFTERSEITVHHTSSASLENSIRERVKRLLNAEVIDITPLDDLDEQLGPITEPGVFKEAEPESMDTPEVAKDEQ